MPYKDRDLQLEAKRKWARENRAKLRGTSVGTLRTLMPADFRFQTALDIVALLKEQIGLLRSDPRLSTPERARTIAYVCGTALRAIDAGDQEARISALEDVLKGRRIA